MKIEVCKFTKELIQDVIDFEKRLREEENNWGWKIDEDYVEAVRRSFEDCEFNNSISLLAYVEDKIVGRIDASIIASHFDGSKKAYLDWICVIKSWRHFGVAQRLLAELIKCLKERKIDTLIGLTDEAEGAQRFYQSIPNSEMKDVGIWIDVK